MGTPEEELEWVDVANELLAKCHIEQKLTKLTDCDANVFISLYENILKEKVPDYIASPGSQEDDVHNIQCVIDSLSLDYLQISLSHITGENVIRGDKESIKNLLDIFDGLLEYLSEEISDDSQKEGSQSVELGEDAPCDNEVPTTSNAIEQMDTKLEGVHMSSDGGTSTAYSSKVSQHSAKCDLPGSSSEVIGLGVSARTFTDQKQDPTILTLTMDSVGISGLSENRDAHLTVPLHTAIPLQPPTQSDSRHQTDTDAHPVSRDAVGHTVEQCESGGVQSAEVEANQVVCNGLHSPAVSDSSQQRTNIGAQTLEATKGGPRKVLFHTQPDVLLLTLQEEASATTPSPPDTEDEDRDPCPPTRPEMGGLQDETGLGSCMEEDDEEDGLSQRRKRNRRTEKELHHISEKLTNRIDELDQMLKRLMTDSGDVCEDEEEESDLSDDIIPCRRTPRTHSGGSTHLISRPRGRHSLPEHFEDETEGRQTNIPPGTLRWQSEPSRRTNHRKNRAYEAELARVEGRKRADLDRERHKAQAAEREYREAILQDFPKVPRMIPHTTKSKVHTQSTSGRLRIPRKNPPLQVKDNELLPLLLEELPFLHISSHDLGRMWQKQRRQVEQLRAQASSRKQQRSKLSDEMEQAQRKHDRLVEMVHKQQEHSKRLKDYKEHIQKQKSTQNRLREQRQQIARARKYHQDYHVQHRARLMKARINEEKMFRELFEEGLEVQKARLREQRAIAAEQRLEHQKRHQQHIQSMENYYKDQFSLLAEKLKQERQEIQIRKKAQEKVLLKMKRDLRSKMEREIGELQKIIIQNDEDDHFQDLEVQRLRDRIRMASYHCRYNYMH
ncbi:centrosomal protein of 95 kDa-like isoform X2 [Corythoichthys intestinalis]|uniref:centrosomal protein of 95 kDa-like isoform X2 n=1 Tax=Corythoichthys intestinalis TaxID=161448 RepID=UPI0025A564EF|nr:centrosomal protein of 95 kDa-like isoform X2 [Corythoichthys intestinalis]